MATLYDFLNADETEVEEQRIIRASGATPGDVLTVAANGTVSPAPGTLKVVDLGVVNLLDVFTNGPRTLYAMRPGEFLAAVKFTDTDYVNPDGLPFGVGFGTVKSFGWWTFGWLQNNNPGVTDAAGLEVFFYDTTALPASNYSYDPRMAVFATVQPSGSSGAMILSAAAGGDVQVAAMAHNILNTNANTGAGVRVDAIGLWVAATGYGKAAENTPATPGALCKCALVAGAGNEIDAIVPSAPSTSGDFTLGVTDSGNADTQVGPLGFNANRAAVAAAFTSAGVSATVTGTDVQTGDLLVEFTGADGNQAVTLTVDVDTTDGFVNAIQDTVGASATAWNNTGASGTSGNSEPDFVGNRGGTVADGSNIVWADTTFPLPTVGTIHAIAEIWTPA